MMKPFLLVALAPVVAARAQATESQSLTAG
jgi:hypothetical protein